MSVSIHYHFIGAHRGASGHYPENTLAAFEAARLAGAQWIEVDVSMLGDGTLIIFHDDRQGRTVQGNERVSRASWSDFEACDAGLFKGSQFSGERILRLEDLRLWAEDTGISICWEMKCHDGRQSETALKLCDALQGMNNHIVSSFDIDFLSAMRAYNADIKLALIADKLPESWHTLSSQLSLSALHLEHHLVTEVDFVTNIHDRGLLLCCWTVNDFKRVQFL